MSQLVAEHPSVEQIRAFAQGQLGGAEFTAISDHILSCEHCCASVEAIPADSFEQRLGRAEQAPYATTIDGPVTLIEVSGVPAELANHPRYRVLSLIGQGGMGAVFKAEHRRMNRLVALKVIHPSLLRNPSTVSRFHQEVRAAAQLSHPNIVTAHDADQAGDLHFLVMEYVEGKSLGELIAERGPLPIPEACEYIRQVAHGLQHAHERGMVHRDIKPHNLMVSASGLKILDFGLARLTQSSESEAPLEGDSTSSAITLTNPGTVMGTADYIAPEQITDARTADIRSDIYSLGCTFYHLLTGKPPFPEGTPADKFRHHAETPIAMPEEWPADLKAIIAKMTAKTSDDRYSTPAQVVEALSGITSAPRETATPVANVTPLKPRRRSLIAAALLSITALIIAAIVILKIQTDKGEITITTDDENIEIVSKKGGEIVRIRDPKSGQTWELDTKKLTMRDLEHPDGLALDVPWRGKVTFRSSGGKVVVMAGPQGDIKEQPTGTSEWVPLFGSNLDGWNSNTKIWNLKDGVLTARTNPEKKGLPHSANLRGDEEFMDFELRFQAKLKEGPGRTRLSTRGSAWTACARGLGSTA